jgi:hypothetical protein
LSRLSGIHVTSILNKLTILIFLSVTTCFGQTKSISIPICNDGDTSLWFKWQQEKFSQVGLLNLLTSNDSLHFRFSTETQSIDIWTNDFNIFYGIFANFTTSYDPDKYKKENPPLDEFYSNKSELDTITARQVYIIFSELSIFDIPADDSLQGWYTGHDGDEYLIEYSTTYNYSFKKYWTPSAYKEKIKEAASIDSLVKQLETRLKMQKSFWTFIDTLPLGCYHTGSIEVTCKSKQKRQTNK